MRMKECIEWFSVKEMAICFKKWIIFLDFDVFLLYAGDTVLTKM